MDTLLIDDVKFTCTVVDLESSLYFFPKFDIPHIG